MKKKILIIAGIIVLMIVLMIAVFVMKDFHQESKLQEEIGEIEKMASEEQFDADSIYEKLNCTVTTGDYALVEKAVKHYLADNFDNSIRMAEALNASELTDALTAENYQTDGPDFVKTKLALGELQGTLTESKEKMKLLMTDESVMSYLNGQLDSYYVDLYKKLIGMEATSSEDMVEIEKHIDEVVIIIEVEQETLDFLSSHKGEWQVQDGEIAFASDELAEQYNELLLKMQ